ncbi:phosphatidylinositol 3-kinase [Strigomonas culicis]|uniref:non-specific serine/threonine protein kinase n=1 Tax=Strigomonas culicis TaxID=28005 RepID=S9UTA2_9TRYP|nr:phosphatidylinositol 3-kinase [Strigomonas culicis]|eukprot:EPY34177.1 phosphatidylinositol 3-kinase [Strigomonas culicis]
MNSPDCEAIDISRAMWHRANTAEQWIERRNVFTTSLATMSMVGYVLGLGDRHLGNILLSMSTGKIVHIDFGDSFDVGRLRHVLPETIPFRLTRMLTNAMEVFGVDGVFRASATNTQTILQKNRDSIMALLSAFVYDPIVQYKGKMKNMMEKSRSPQDVAERIRNKLRGTELAVHDSSITPLNTTSESCKRPDLLFMSKAFDDDAERDQTMAMGPEEQVGYLIQEAVRTDNYTTLYFGWGPLW